MTIGEKSFVSIAPQKVGMASQTKENCYANTRPTFGILECDFLRLLLVSGRKTSVNQNYNGHYESLFCNVLSQKTTARLNTSPRGAVR
jgi:hypothetical protein